MGPALDRWPMRAMRRPLAVLLCLGCALAGAPWARAQNIERSGKEVVTAICAECHETGLMGAPKIGDKAAWTELASHGLTGLTDSAIHGVRRMPPHGGSAKVTDTEIKRAISYMVNQSGGHWVEPISRHLPPVKRAGAEVVQAHCARCHRNGVNGAPGIGDRAAWIPRLKEGFEVLVASAIRGQGPMPARSDAPGLTDSEIRDAVAYMIDGPGAATPRPSTAPGQVSDPDQRKVDGAPTSDGPVGWLRRMWKRL